MNLVKCNQDCCYEKDGYCKLNAQASVSGEIVDGCAYFKKRNKVLKSTKNINQKNGIKRQEIL